MTLLVQAKLLRFLQDGKFIKVGGEKEFQADVRIIAATNKNLQAAIKAGRFRDDLFFRLNVVPIYIMPLRDRKEDIPILVLYFLDVFNKQYKVHKRITCEVMNELINYSWPGNVRELKNTIERLVLITLSEVIAKEDLTYTNYITERYNAFETPVLTRLNDLKDDKEASLKEIMNDLERNVICKAVQKYGTIRKAAQILKVAPSTISRKLSKYNM